MGLSLEIQRRRMLALRLVRFGRGGTEGGWDGESVDSVAMEGNSLN